MIRKKIAIHYEECREMVLSDEKWLEFVVEQILSNAIKMCIRDGYKEHTVICDFSGCLLPAVHTDYS